MSVQDVGFDRPIAWPSNGISEVPFRLYTDPEQYRIEQERIFKGPTWNYLCLAGEIPEPGDWVATTIGEVAVIVARGRGRRDQRLRQPLRPSRQSAVPDEQGARQGNHLHLSRLELRSRRPPDRRSRSSTASSGRAAWRPNSARRTTICSGCGSPNCAVSCSARSTRHVEDLETYLGPLVVGGMKRVLNRPFHIIGRSTQILPNNWKLYFENVKDTYHASILHSFLTTFRINRLSMPGSINIDESGGNHFSQAKLDYAAEDADYKAAQLRSDTDLKLRDPSIVQAHDEYGDQVSVQILTVFPNMVLQQVRNTIAVRVIRPRGVDKTELDWVHLGFDDDDEAMTERRLRQGNLIGAAGYIALEDGCVGGFVQRALRYNDDDSGVVMMGGHEAQSQNFRASEAAIRGFWKKYRALTGA